MLVRVLIGTSDNDTTEAYNQNPVKHRKCSFLWKLLTAEICETCLVLTNYEIFKYVYYVFSFFCLFNLTQQDIKELEKLCSCLILKQQIKLVLRMRLFLIQCFIFDHFPFYRALKRQRRCQNPHKDLRCRVW